MELITRNLFLDTQYLINRRLNFHDKELSSMKDLVNRNLLNVFLTDITDREIRKKIKEKHSVAFEKITTSDISYLKNIPLFNRFLETYDKSKIIERVLKEYQNFINDCEITIVSSDRINFLPIFESYCHEKPPFNSTAKKDRRAEFPDALIMATMTRWGETSGQKAYLLSNDSDWKEFAQKSYRAWPSDDNKPIFTVTTFSNLTDAIIRLDDSMADKVTFADQVFTDKTPLIESTALVAIRDISIDLYPGFLDVEVDDYRFLSAKITNKDLISVEESSANYDVYLEVELLIYYTLVDHDKSYYDSEDQKYLFIKEEKTTLRHIIEINLEIEMYYPEGIVDDLQLQVLSIPVELPVSYEDGEFFDEKKWIENHKVIICGVENRTITEDGSGVVEFKDISEARQAFPELDIENGSKDFSPAMGDKIIGPLRFETRAALKFYSN